ncbi:hypothetical protein AK812_SmicGene15351 [Symbiodinium microadriaticum]|uniref:Uncharacterized protein n=1 Tax=Symbiodinium microadriaticum TaxID=2951 RepID=A0A1Q9E361_SYMMI|nr:hypothetical protein AK812_SmicGene15351 [Symbiodinium microadriaticum]
MDELSGGSCGWTMDGTMDELSGGSCGWTMDGTMDELSGGNCGWTINGTVDELSNSMEALILLDADRDNAVYLQEFLNTYSLIHAARAETFAEYLANQAQIFLHLIQKEGARRGQLTKMDSAVQYACELDCLRGDFFHWGTKMLQRPGAQKVRYSAE